MKDTLMNLSALSGVSGCEHEVREYILERVMPFAGQIETDAMGNLIIFKKGRVATEQKIMLAAHMDEVGLIVTNFADDGYLRFDCVGGIDRRVLIGKRILIGEGAVPGIISLKAHHLVTADEEKKVPKVDEMLIDIGCRTKDDAKKIVSLGDYCVFDQQSFEIGDGYLLAKAIDDRVGCAAMIKLIESELPCDTWFAFTVQEEVGTRGATVASGIVNCDVCLVLEGTTATNMPGVSGAKQICTSGDGIVIPFMDGATIYDRGIYETLCDTAERLGIKWQTKHRIAGGTDAGAIQKSRGGVKVGAVSVAVSNIHSPSSIAKISECGDMLKLALAFLETISKD